MYCLDLLQIILVTVFAGREAVPYNPLLSVESVMSSTLIILSVLSIPGF
jgi:hypothetical protein